MSLASYQTAPPRVTSRVGIFFLPCAFAGVKVGKLHGIVETVQLANCASGEKTGRIWRYAENDVPQPQVPVAFGLENLKPPP